MKKRYSAYGILAIICVILLGTGFIKAKSVWSNFNNRLDSINTAIHYSQYAEQGWQNVKMIFDGQEIYLNTNENGNVVELNSLNTEIEVPVQFTFPENYSVVMDGIPVKPGIAFNYKVAKIGRDHYIPIDITNMATNETKHFSIRTWPMFLPTYTVVGKSPYPGDYYITPFIQGGAIYKVDRNGNLKYYRYSSSMLWDFKKIETVDGIRYIYCEQVASVHTPKASTGSAEYVVMDEDYHEIKRLRMAESERIADTDWPADQHDMLYVNDSEYYLISYVNKNVSNIPSEVPHRTDGGVFVIATIIQGFKDGKLFFEWDSTDYPELYAQSYETNDFNNISELPADYMHINSLDIDKKDGNLIASFRNQSSIYKIDTNTREILWKLGGMDDDYQLLPDQKPSCQHYARYNDNGSITIFDNGNANQQTRVAEYWLDEENHILTDFRSYQIDGYYSWATGSAQRLTNEADVFMIGWGLRADSAPYLQPNCSEIDFTNGKTLFELRFDDNNIDTYRCVKYQ